MSNPSGRRVRALPLRARLRALGAVSALATTTMVTFGASPAAADGASYEIYADSLAAGWKDWSWGGSRDLQAAGDGSHGRVIRWRTDRPWGGLYLHADASRQASADATVKISVKPLDAGARLNLILFGEDLRPVGKPHPLQAGGAALPAGVWTTIGARVGDLGTDGQRITGVAIQDATGTSGKRVEVDDVRIVGPTPAAQPVSQPAASPASQPAAGTDAPEIRPGNATPNATRGRPTDPSRFHGHEGFRPYYSKVNGNFTGTTEEILAWAAAKWGMGNLGYPDLAKAVAVHESWWRQETVGRHGERGLVQVHPVWPDSEPAAWSTAFAADYGMAVIRHHYDGASWLGEATRGNIRNAVSAWECGCGWNGQNWYAKLVFDSHESKVWRRPGVAPEWF